MSFIGHIHTFEIELSNPPPR